MASFEERFCLRNPTLLQAVRRDLELLADSGRFLLLWATLGRRVRRAARRAQAGGEPLFLEDILKADKE
jgi:hypothetical protein